ncbi:MAG: hypothetical protein E6R03_08660 [Hyphomicrobiaceae bacterium]|nr:MAG: hypothetical protein E6R03_08660 [Hyphomicrobiaceae bacterium]
MALRDSTAVNAGANGGTVAAPAGLAENDIVLLRVLLAGYNNLAITWPAGFTQIGNTSCDASVAADVRTHKVAWARMGASPPANFAVSWTGNDASTIHCAAFSGRSTTSDPVAFDTQPGAGTTSRPLSLAATGGTMVAGDDVAWFTDVFGGGDAGTFTPPTDYTAQETSTNLYAIGQLATRNNVAAGSTTPITGSWTGPAAQAYSWGAIVVRIPVASSAPTISAGTPTGTVGANTTVGFTSTASTGTARIVIDTAANLDTVTNTQVAAGQKENGTAAAYDSGNITVTDTTPEFAFTGLTSGTWTACAVHDGSTVLSWTFTVDATGPTITSGPTVTNITASGFDVGATSNESGTARLLVTAYGAAQPNQAAFDASTETATATANTPFSIHHTGQ